MAALPEKDQRALLSDITKLEEHIKRTKLGRMFPDTGPLRRELYAKHCQFFRDGSWAQARALVGGNGCISPWTRIETVEGAVPISELAQKSSFVVRSWDGGSQCDAVAGGVFLKEYRQAFRVHLDNGQWFDCTDRHRVLTTEGWLWFGQLVHASSGLRYWRTVPGSPGSCDKGDRQGDARPRPAQGIDRASPPSKAYVQGLVRFSVALGDVSEHRPRYIHACREPDHQPSRLYDPCAIAARISEHEDPTAALDAQWCSDLRQALWQLALESFPSRVWQQDPLDQFALDATGLSYDECLARVVSATQHQWADQDRLRFPQHFGPCEFDHGSLSGNCGDWLFVPYDHPILVGGNRIVSITPLGVIPILDLTVEGTKCYLSAGVYHHNTGKTEGGGYETACHLTGQYPEWWEGKKFDRPIVAWIGGDTTKTVRDIIQFKLFGVTDHRSHEIGTGIIPHATIGKVAPSNQLSGLIDYVRIKHKSGGWSTLYLKSYDQGRQAWQGSEVDWIWLDEQVDMDIYEECFSRFRGKSKDGRLILTFTGLKGATDVVLKFLPELTPDVDEKSMREAGRARVIVAMEDVPHLSPEEIERKLANYSGLFRETRRTGIPYAGSGRVYTVDEDAFVVQPFKLPAHFALIAGADFGYGSEDGQGGTAAVWGAYDRDGDVVYVFDEYFRAQAEAPVHAAALTKHGDWVPVAGDYAGVAINEGQRGKIVRVYKDLGVNIHAADKDVEAGILQVQTRLAQSKLRIFSTCSGLIQEYRMYNRDEKGRIIKKNDHRLDALRYLVMSLGKAKTKPIPKQVNVKAETFGFY